MQKGLSHFVSSKFDNFNMNENLIIGIHRLEQISKKINSRLNGNFAEVVLHLPDLRTLARDLESCINVLDFFLQLNQENPAESDKTAIQSTKNESPSAG